ncbi:sodium:solute symporter family protein [Geoalkalibacter halelectricus]|uniref:Sodium:solute symporter family protein n=1 Tax=Geoalkalibacter halelectricus TaxID=2847045 RepID=A0ABY5ZM21_9BACT|nr:sodium:solute symporter family protein [Geoalkalibacter halelectricus]MDO3377990.1 sodium:solute symporter family protein [Geoalkalibacter halelectricus]UWZ78291.1 sodium:solute symporter family protein [Geoalkalibacter halelectricus]
MTADPWFLLAFVATLGALLWLAAGRGRVRDGADFALAGRRAGAWQVSGAIMGTLVGGASTVGTAQLAFLYGFSAWWFTLGAGLACLFLGLFLAAPLRRCGVETIPQFISRYHGERVRKAASLFSALGMFIHVVAQLLAAAAILSSLFGLSLKQAALAAALGVALITWRGGMPGAGTLGLAKLFFLYLCMVGAGGVAFHLSGGWGGLRGHFPEFPWFSLFGYGTAAGVSDLVSMLVGVVSTQTYLQAVFSARDAHTARRGALISAVLIPPLGLFGISVGLFMRQSAPALDSARALPEFLLQHMPPAFAGLAFAALLIAALATAAGLTLGVGTTLRADLLVGQDFGRRDLLLRRALTLAVVLLALGLVLANLDSAIMAWSFLSMGLRGATLCLPLLAAVFLGARTSRRGGALAILLAPPTVVAAGWFDAPLPPLFLGLGVALAAFAWGFFRERRRPFSDTLS